jgi:WD40 repeat protein
LATGGQDNKVKLWDVGTGQLLPREFSTGPAATLLLALEFSPDGHYLAAADHDRKVRLWDVADGAEVRLPDDLLAVWGLAFTPDGRQLITVNTEGVVKVWDVSDRRMAGEPFRAKTRAAGYRVAFSPDRHLLALGCEDGTIKVVATNPLKEVRTLDAHIGDTSGMAFGAGDERLASAGDDLIVKVWDLRTGQQSLSLDIVKRRANPLAFSPDGQRLAVGSADGAVQILDGTPLTGLGDGGQVLTLAGHSHTVVGLAYSPDGRRIASASRDWTAKVWDADSGREVVTFRGHQAPLTAVAWLADGRRVATASWDGTARVWDAVTGTEIFPPLDARRGSVYGIAFNRIGNVLATGHHDGSLRVWDAASGRQKVSINLAHDHPAYDVTFSPDGEQLVSAGGADNKVKVWDWQADPPKLVRPPLEAPENIIRNPTYSPDGVQLVAIVANPPRLWMWDMTTGVGNHKDLVDSWKTAQAVFTPNGRLAIVSGGRIQFLEPDGSDGPALVGCHAGEIACAAFSPDGRHMATGAGFKGRGEVRIWDASKWEKSP